MTDKERSEWLEWWHFCSRRVREFIFLAVWVTTAWALDKYFVHRFPLDGAPKYMLFAFERLFDIYTLLELVLLLFWPYKAHTSRWLNKRRRR